MSIDSRSLQIIGALEQELSAKSSAQAFTAQELAMIDHLHTRGYAATVYLANMIGISHDMRVLDLGSGLGGPARYLAQTYGCFVEGIDLTPGLVEAAEYLSTRWVGPREKVHFAVGDATSVPFPDGTFDVVWMQHVAMNIADRTKLYREIRRLLRIGGQFATYDVVRAGDELVYPTPWASDGALSTVLTTDETRSLMEHAGLHVASVTLDTDAALQWVQESAAAVASGQRPRGAQMLRAALGENFREALGNLGRNYFEGRADVAAIVARRDD